MLGNILGLRELREKKSILSNYKALLVFSIFFEDWYSLKEASIIYVNEHLPDGKKIPSKENYVEVRDNKTTRYYFEKFKKYGWLDCKEIFRIKKNGYPSKCPRYRANYEMFFFDKPYLENKKSKILAILNKESTKKNILKHCQHKVFILASIQDYVFKKILKI